MSECRDFLLKPTGRPIHAVAIEACENHQITMAQLLSSARSAYIVRARQEVMYRAYRELGASLPVIGHFLHRDHTTVLHGVRAHAERLTQRAAINYGVSAYPHAVASARHDGSGSTSHQEV